MTLHQGLKWHLKWGEQARFEDSFFAPHTPYPYILSKGCKLYNFELHKSLKLSFTNVQGLRSDFVECKFFLESNSPDIFAQYETNLDDSTDSGNLSVRGYLPLIQKDPVTHIHGLAVYVEEGLLLHKTYL